ncbi:MAG: response regulator [Bdellovibrio sp.]|nr:response regulator [Bdellovibrio sp.]
MKTPQQKVLIIDDERSICKFIRLSLESNNFSVVEAYTGEEGIKEVIASRPDIIILDLGLPDVHGLEVIKKVREWTQIPIIILSVQDSDEDKVQALDSGADDYLTKPFSVPELLARIRVALRHSFPEKSVVFKAGNLEIEWSAKLVKISGQSIKLTVTEYNILSVLAKYAGKVVTHRMILKEVWGPNAVEHTQYLRVYVGQIRRKLQINSLESEIIVTEAGVGYRLVVD